MTLINKDHHFLHYKLIHKFDPFSVIFPPKIIIVFQEVLNIQSIVHSTVVMYTDNAMVFVLLPYIKKFNFLLSLLTQYYF